jgi:formate hydrogenlyase subunit 3/multisubunit Na+/H+ antiporter MnhD subunit
MYNGYLNKYQRRTKNTNSKMEKMSEIWQITHVLHVLLVFSLVCIPTLSICLTVYFMIISPFLFLEIVLKREDE